MTLKQKIKSLLLGIDFPQEYLCLGLKENDEFPSIHLHWDQSGQSIDVTQAHLFLGYKPLIIGIPTTNEDKTLTSNLRSGLIRLILSQPNPIAQIELTFSHEIHLGD